jgi:ATP-dependent RNA helicase DeaD
MTFAELAVHPSLARALTEKGYAAPTPVQAAVASAPVDRDLLVSAQTGSGKTVAFGLASAPTLLGDAERFTKAGKPLALVIAPTRELAMQVQRELTWLYQPSGGRVTTCVGGMEPRRERAALEAGTHIVVGTPGRLCDHLERGALDLSELKVVVLDEADEMLDMGFRDELERILQDAPVSRRTLLFSATLPQGIVQLAARYQKDAERIAIQAPAEGHRDITYRVHPTSIREREHVVVNVLREAEAAAAIVFVSTRDAVNHLHANLVERGFEAVALSGELTQPERTRALKALRDGRARVLVATDVAARGLDLPDVGLVIHADLPHDAQVLQHRSGRTGRAGRTGTAVLLVPQNLRRAAERLLREAKLKAPWTHAPTPEAIHRLDESRIVADVGSLGADVIDDDRAVAKKLLEEKPAEEVAAMLVSILRGRRPAPEDLPLSSALALLELKSPRAAPHAPGSEPRGPAAGPGPRGGTHGVWFALNVGRDQNADPRWLIPLICRKGNITKSEIGAIRILPHETRVEIAPYAAAHFDASVRRPDRQDPSLRIIPSAPPAVSGPPTGARPPARDGFGPREGRPMGDGPRPPPRGPRGR